MGPSPSIQVGGIYSTNRNGFLEVIEYVNCEKVTVRFLFTGFVRVCKAGNIKRGKVSDPLYPTFYGVGCIGVGKYTANITGTRVASLEYEKWYSMLGRCYDEKVHIRNPTYKECYVCDEWLNFQAFAEWFQKNYPYDGKVYHLDKDIKNKGNKMYGPDSCVFATQYDNTQAARAKQFKIISPDGVVTNVEPSIREFSNKNGLNRSSVTALLAGKIKSGMHKGWKLWQQ